jgi:PAS domain S-box-containing protein
VVDLLQNPQRSRDDQIVAIPTLVVQMMSPVRAREGSDISLALQNAELRAQLAELRAPLEEADATPGAIRSGAVDAIAVDTPAGKRVFILKGAEQPYRVMVEAMSEGAVTVTPCGDILFCNERFSDMVKAGLQNVIGSGLPARFADDDAAKIAAAIRRSQAGTVRLQATLLASDATSMPVTLAICRSGGGGTPTIAIVVTDLTDVVAAQGERQISDDRYRTLVEAMNDGLLQVDENLTITFVNSQFARLLGYEEAELLGRRTIEFMDETTRQSLPAWGERHKAGLAGQYDLAWQARDGRSVPTLVSSRPLFDPDGCYRGTLSVITDVTELKRIEKRRDDLARVVENAEDAITAEDLPGLVTFWNKGAEWLYGYTAAEVLGKPIAILASPGHRDDSAELICKIARGESIEHHETERVTRSGKRIWVSLRMSPIRDDAGTIIGVSTIGRDVTTRRDAEAGLQAAALYARSLIEASLDPLVTISAEGQITDVNEATIAATGVPRDRMIGSDFSTYFTEPEKARAGYRQAFAEGFVREYSLSLRHASGRIIDVVYNASLYRNEKGAVVGLFAAARDITERKRAEEALQKYREELEQTVGERMAALSAANARLESANQELEAFSYSVSHDLRTPLRAVDGFSRILVQDYSDKLDAEGQRVLAVVRDSTVKIGHLIDDILAFSRIGRAEMKTAPLDMAALVRDTLTDPLAPAVAGRALAIDIGELPDAHGDKAMLRRVWMNLLDNAIKYTAPKPDARIAVGATAGDGETIYHVRDNGVGFDMQYAGKLFGVFQRLHGAEFPGTGIGLSIVKRIVTRHGGRVWAEGKVGEGATFYFALPKARSSRVRDTVAPE